MFRHYTQHIHNCKVSSERFGHRQIIIDLRLFRMHSFILQNKIQTTFSLESARFWFLCSCGPLRIGNSRRSYDFVESMANVVHITSSFLFEYVFSLFPHTHTRRRTLNTQQSSDRFRSSAHAQCCNATNDDEAGVVYQSVCREWKTQHRKMFPMLDTLDNNIFFFFYS